MTKIYTKGREDALSVAVNAPYFVQHDLLRDDELTIDKNYRII